MPRGKHRAQADRRGQEKLAERETALRERIEKEAQLRAGVDSDLAEMEELTRKALAMRTQIAAIRSREADELREEIGSLLREITELTFVSDREFRKRNRFTLSHGGGIELLEQMVDGHTDDTRGALITEGVHAKNLSSEAIERIQRARGIRKPGSPTRTQSQEHIERLQRIERER